MIRFDHIAIGCETLEQGAAYVRARTGHDVPFGGKHKQMATHNRVMATGPNQFLEIIARDPNAANPGHPRWFGLDNTEFSTARPLSWILDSTDLEADLAIAKSRGIDFGAAKALRRGDLEWKFAVRPDGAIPLGGAAPMLMQWPKMPTHPASRMTNSGAKIAKVEIRTPHADEITALLQALGGDVSPVVLVPDDKLTFTVTLVLPDGRAAVLD